MSNIRKYPPVGAARFVGRVGALAVALGIGTAIFNSAGIAQATTGESGTGTSASGTSAPGAAGESSGQPGGRKTQSGKPIRRVGKKSADDAPSPRDNKPKQSALPKSVASAVPGPSQTADQAAPTAASSHGSDADGRQPSRPAKVTRTTTEATPSAAAATAEPTAPEPVAPVSSAVSDTVSTVALSGIATRPNVTVNPTGGPVAPLQNAALWTLFGVGRREVGPSAISSTAAMAPQSAQATSVLITAQQLAAEQQADKIVKTLPMQLMKLLLKWGFQAAAKKQFALVGGPDQANLDQLNQAVDEYARQAAMEYQLLNPMNPTVLQMVMPPHTWAGQTVDGTRILYDNPDTIYRMMAVNSTSSYVITGKFTPGQIPAETTFSVLTGLGGNTTLVLNSKDMQINPDGSFTVTASSAAAASGPANHLQIPVDATLIVARNTLSDWNSQQPMSLAIERVGGPPDSLFAQIGGFDIPGLGPLVAGNTFLTNLVSMVPPLPKMPMFLQGLESSIVMALGLQMEPQYIAVATTDASGNQKQPNLFTDPQRNATFLATQLQSAGYFQLTDQQALVLTIKPGNAGYFVVPVTNDWTVTDNYWDQQTSLNNAQAIANSDGSYTIVVSPTDPGVANWVSTGGLNQGTISLRFQRIDTASENYPKVSSQVVSIDRLGSVLPAGTTYVTAAQRAAVIAQRKVGYDSRFAPSVQV